MSSDKNFAFQAKNILSWKNIDIEVKNLNRNYDSKVIKIVSDACGEMEPGILAIMGPSGSGKTTLLKTLSGYIPENCSTTGQVLLNGKARDMDDWVRNIGFVEQDSLFFENLTVFEVLEYAAKFRMKKKNKELTASIENLLMELSISHISKSKMKSVSGGEKKRVLIAVEIICDPKILFLDEPTSGLDNNSSKKIIDYLETISKQGKMVIMTVHQPSQVLLAKFDKILLLSQGRTVFFGCTPKCEPYLKENGFGRLENESFSDFALRILDIDQGIYRGPDKPTVLDKMVNEMRNKYGSGTEIKRITTVNQVYVQNNINFKHVGLLFMRKFKTRSLFKGTSLQMLISTVMALIVSNFWLFYYLPVFKESMVQNKKEIVSNSHNSSGKDVLFYHLKNCDLVYNFISLMFLSSHISLTMLSTCAFSSEIDIIRHEIAKAGYSHYSYLFATCLFEILCSSIFLPFVWMPVYLLADLLNAFTVLLMSLVYYVACIMFSLMFSPLSDYVTLIKSGKIANPFNSLAQMGVMGASYFIYEFYSETTKNLPFYLLNLICPTYTIFLLLRLLLMDAEIADFHSKKITVPKQLPIQYLCIFDIDPKFALIFPFISMVISFFVASLLIKKSISPRIRLKLNLE